MKDAPDHWIFAAKSIDNVWILLKEQSRVWDMDRLLHNYEGCGMQLFIHVLILMAV